MLFVLHRGLSSTISLVDKAIAAVLAGAATDALPVTPRVRRPALLPFETEKPDTLRRHYPHDAEPVTGSLLH